MKIIVLANSGAKEELLSGGLADGTELVWINKLEEFSSHAGADAYIDLLFEDHADRKDVLQQLLPATVIVNSVIHTLQEIHPLFVRINGWPGFLRSEIVEASTADDFKDQVSSIFSCFHKTVVFVDDAPGFITPRVISMIINEAFLALEETVSSRQDIDTAMKLGTNYPYGPFEWADMIGKARLQALLQKLYLSEKRYQPAALLKA